MTKRVTLILSDEDHEILEEAARIAGRDPQKFIAEEALSLANLIAAQGSTKGLPLARTREADAADFIEAFRQSTDKADPVADWAKRAHPGRPERSRGRAMRPSPRLVAGGQGSAEPPPPAPGKGRSGP